MYRELYELLNKQGRVKRAIFLDGIYKGEFMTEHHRAGDFWYPYLKEIEKIEETKILDTEKGRIFVEILEKNPHLVILGGGHVSCPVAHMAKMLGFHVTVMDDREEFLTKERFPDADERILGSFDEFGEKIPVYENAYYVVVTRGHQGRHPLRTADFKASLHVFWYDWKQNKGKTYKRNASFRGI